MSFSKITFVCVFAIFGYALSANTPITPTTKATLGSTEKSDPNSPPSSSVLDKLPILDFLKNPKVIHGYTGCILDKGPCTPDAAEVKSIMSDAMTNGCSKCTPMQKQVFETLINNFTEKQPEILKEVSAKYDPQGKYKAPASSLKKGSAKKE